METRIGRSFVLTAAGAIGLALGCAQDLVANEGEADGGGGSGGVSAAGSSTLTGDASAGGSGGSPVGSGGGSSHEALPSQCMPVGPLQGALWPASPSECPAEPPDPDDPDQACDGPDDARCVYSSSRDSWPVCACLYDRNVGNKRWTCDFFSDIDPACPELPPEPGSSCAGARATTCRFPAPFSNQICRCADTDDLQWSCETAEHEEDALPLAPADLALSTAVADLTDDERNSLCAWAELRHHGGTGYTPIAPVAVDPDGFTSFGGACEVEREFRDQILWPFVSQAQCVANLALSSCNAPVGDLVDCVVARDDERGVHARSCGPYAAHASCNGTMLRVFDACNEPAGIEQCRLRVE